MRTETLTFDGIKRITSPQNPGNGACDDLQNMRYEYGSLRAVHGFNKALEGSSKNIIKAFVHRIGDTENLIIVTRNSTAGTCSVSLVTDSGTDEIKSFADGDRNSIEVTSINNILTIKCDEFNSVGGGRIYSYLWNNGEYNEWYNGRLPENPTFKISKGDVTVLDDTLTIPSSDNPSVNTLYGYAASSYNRLCHNEDHELTEGYVLVCINYTLFDGNETKPSAPVLIQLGGVAESASQSPGGSSTSGFSVDARYIIRFSNDDGVISAYTKIGVQGASLKLDDSAVNSSFYNKNKDLIKSINVYSTYPSSIFDLEDSMNTFRQYIDSVIDGDVKVFLYGAFGNTTSGAQNTIYSRMSISSLKFLENVIFYRQESIPMSEDLSRMKKEINLRFDESLLSAKRMEVDSSGNIQHCGHITAYNNRMHVYNLSSIVNSPNLLWGSNHKDYVDPSPTIDVAESSSVSTKSREPEGGFNDIYDDPGTGTATIYCLVYLKNSNSDITTFHSFNAEYDGMLLLPLFVSYPDSRAYKVELYFTNSSGTKYKGTLFLNQSATYNFSYAMREITYGRGTVIYNTLVGVNEYTGSIPTSASAHPEYSSPGQMIVSAQNNPAYFAPENSYSFQGAITAVTPLTDAVSEAQFGQFPLAVFTTEGIWTLERGSGDVLYSRSVKISDISCFTGNVIQTKTGVYFTAEGSVWRLSGRKIEKISEIAEGDPDAYLEQNAEFAALCRSSKCISVPVKKSITEVVSTGYPLAYDQFNDELYVGYSDSSVEFSFVYGVRTGLWRSDTRRILHQSGPVAVLSSYGEWQDRSGDVIRMDSENASDTSFVAVMMKTRPFSLGSYGYKSIHRLISRCLLDAGSYQTSTSAGSLGENLGKGLAGIYLFASNDLMEWSLVGGDQYEGITHRMQIMKISGSYRYYALVIAGYMKSGGSVSATELMIDDRYSGKIR